MGFSLVTNLMNVEQVASSGLTFQQTRERYGDATAYLSLRQNVRFPDLTADQAGQFMAEFQARSDDDSFDSIVGGVLTLGIGSAALMSGGSTAAAVVTGNVEDSEDLLDYALLDAGALAVAPVIAGATAPVVASGGASTSVATGSAAATTAGEAATGGFWGSVQTGAAAFGTRFLTRTGDRAIDALINEIDPRYSNPRAGEPRALSGSNTGLIYPGYPTYAQGYGSYGSGGGIADFFGLGNGSGTRSGSGGSGGLSAMLSPGFIGILVFGILAFVGLTFLRR